MKIRLAVVLMALAICQVTPLLAAGVSPYLPLSTNPSLERQIARALALAGEPPMRRPIAAAQLLDVLPRLCAVDTQLCGVMHQYLEPYTQDAAVLQADASVNLVTGDDDLAVPNAHGQRLSSPWSMAAAGFYQPSDHLLLNTGAVAYQGNATVTGTYLSAGFDFAQLDIGYRDHWFSPMLDSSILISTEAPTMPSISLSSPRAISPLGVSYEVFLARMSRQQNIQYYNDKTSGHPSLAGIQLSMSPVGGYAVSLNRLMQYGGGARGGTSLSELKDALWVNSNKPDVVGTSQEFGNQVASLASSMTFPGRVPFVVRMEFAGEDNSYSGHYRLGDSALMLGLDFPVIAGRFDANYEYSEWQNVWYTHHIYPDGLSNFGAVLGHWFGDQRKRNDPVTGSSHSLQLGVRADSGAYWQAMYRTAGFGRSLGASALAADESYQHLHQLTLRYSDDWRGKGYAGELYAGRGALTGNYAGIKASVSLRKLGAVLPSEDTDQQNVSDSGLVFFVDIGANNSHLRDIIKPDEHYNWTNDAIGSHIGLGFRRPVAERSDLGVRLELDQVHGRNVVSLRALDYRYRIGNHLAWSGFFGVGRLHEEAVALGYYWGAGLQWRNIISNWDIGLDKRVHDKMSRNRILPQDPPDTSGIQPRLHTDVTGFSFYLSRSF